MIRFKDLIQNPVFDKILGVDKIPWFNKILGVDKIPGFNKILGVDKIPGFDKIPRFGISYEDLIQLELFHQCQFDKSWLPRWQSHSCRCCRN